MKQPQIVYQLDQAITPIMEKEIIKRVEFNLSNKMTSPLKKIYC